MTNHAPPAPSLKKRLLRRHPGGIVFLAPLCTFFLTVLVGTGHVVYTLMPIIVDISIKKNIHLDKEEHPPGARLRRRLRREPGRHHLLPHRGSGRGLRRHLEHVGL